MKYILILIAIIGTMQIVVNCTKDIDYTIEDFELIYVMSGLGSNLGQMMPKLHIKGNEFVLTSEQNSYLGKQTKKPVLKQKGRISTTSINEILAISNSLSQYQIKQYESSMSGAIISLQIKNNNQKWSFELLNKSDGTVSKIIDILNKHLKDENQLFDMDYSDIKY